MFADSIVKFSLRCKAEITLCAVDEEMEQLMYTTVDAMHAAYVL